jgi:hypothetical protein
MLNHWHKNARVFAIFGIYLCIIVSCTNQKNKADIKKKKAEPTSAAMLNNKEGTMASNSRIDYGNIENTRVIFEGKETIVSLDDGLEMRESLRTYLERNTIQYDEFREELLSRLKDAAIWIDGENGSMRIGHWLLHNQAEDLLLTNRLRTPRPVGAYVAALGRDVDSKKWFIKNVIFLRLFAR